MVPLNWTSCVSFCSLIHVVMLFAAFSGGRTFVTLYMNENNIFVCSLRKPAVSLRLMCLYSFCLKCFQLKFCSGKMLATSYFVILENVNEIFVLLVGFWFTENVLCKCGIEFYQ